MDSLLENMENEGFLQSRADMVPSWKVKATDHGVVSDKSPSSKRMNLSDFFGTLTFYLISAERS